MFILIHLQNTLSNSNQASVIESNNKNRLKSMKAKSAAIESVTPSNGMSSQIVMQDVLSIKSYLHKLSRILQVIVGSNITELIKERTNLIDIFHFDISFLFF